MSHHDTISTLKDQSVQTESPSLVTPSVNMLANTNQTQQLTALTILTQDIDATGRIRSDLGDLKGLIASIREFGVIQPIVLTRTLKLIAGGRRYAALCKMNMIQLRHGKEFIYSDEVPTDQVRLQAIELEENLKRKDLSWSEICLGKKKLLEVMQSIHGVRAGGAVSLTERRSGQLDGFSQAQLAAMLGETPAATSKDIEMGRTLEKFPQLAKLPTKTDAQRRMNVAVTVATMQQVGKIAQAKHEASGATQKPQDWTLYHGDFLQNIQQVADASVDLVLSDLPYNISLTGGNAGHSSGLGGFNDVISDPTAFYTNVATESFRILSENRFAVFFFGFGDYSLLLDALQSVGFTVDPYPFIWLRDRTAPADGFARYSKSYDPAFICSKGKPTFVRPNQQNSLSVPSVRGPERTHAAQKPVEVMQKFIEDMTAVGSTVVDLMAGSGTTGVAAVKTKRKCIMFELEEPNCVIIEARMRAL